jgi:hypothetical protein
VSGPQTPPQCPDWCTDTSARHNIGSHQIHSSDFYGPPEIAPSRPWIVREWTNEGGWEAPVLTLPAPLGIVDLQAPGVRSVAQMIEQAHPGSPLAKALREAADELDRIIGSTT